MKNQLEKCLYKSSSRRLKFPLFSIITLLLTSAIFLLASCTGDAALPVGGTGTTVSSGINEVESIDSSGNIPSPGIEPSPEESLPEITLEEIAYSRNPSEVIEADTDLPEDSSDPDENMPEDYSEIHIPNTPIRNTPSISLPELVVALTFDDGPIQYTNLILDILEIYGGRVTFCVLGYRVEGHRDIIIRAHKMGNEIIGHSWSHPDFTLIDDEAMIHQITGTSDAIEAVIGYRPTIYRAPFGNADDRIESLSAELGYSLLHWSLDPQDWLHRNPDLIYAYIMREVASGDIIVLHDIRPTTAQAMQMVIPSLIERGFTLVTASEILIYRFGSLEPGWVYKGGTHMPTFHGEAMYLR